jgi:hypothetical protein
MRLMRLMSVLSWREKWMREAQSQQDQHTLTQHTHPHQVCDVHTDTHTTRVHTEAHTPTHVLQSVHRCLLALAMTVTLCAQVQSVDVNQPLSVTATFALSPHLSLHLGTRAW